MDNHFKYKNTFLMDLHLFYAMGFIFFAVQRTLNAWKLLGLFTIGYCIVWLLIYFGTVLLGPHITVSSDIIKIGRSRFTPNMIKSVEITNLFVPISKWDGFQLLKKKAPKPNVYGAKLKLSSPYLGMEKSILFNEYSNSAQLIDALKEYLIKNNLPYEINENSVDQI